MTGAQPNLVPIWLHLVPRWLQLGANLAPLGAKMAPPYSFLGPAVSSCFFQAGDCSEFASPLGAFGSKPLDRNNNEFRGIAVRCEICTDHESEFINEEGLWICRFCSPGKCCDECEVTR